MNFTEEQNEIIGAPTGEKTIVVANAAAGKTAVLTARLQHILESGIPEEEIVCITFTNNAAFEMKQRLNLADDSKLFVGTIHGYANKILNDAGISTQAQLKAEDFDELFNMIVRNKEVVQKVSYLLCDESQDLDENQFHFIINMINSKGYLLVGDPKQSIYGFRGADPTLLEELTGQPDWMVRYLLNNFRNSARINNLGNEIVGKMSGFNRTLSTGVRKEQGEILRYSYLRLANVLKEYAHGHYENWAILCRSNSQIYAVQNMLGTAGIPTITFKKAENTLEELEKKQKTNAVKVLTVHSAKGLEFDNVILADKLQDNQRGEAARLYYVAVTRARDRLFLRR